MASNRRPPDPALERRCGEVLRAWRRAPRGSPQPCPKCDAPGVVITDRSARPHTEWYHFACPACGLDHTVSIPLASRPPALD